MCGTTPIDEKAEKMGWYDLIKTVHHAFEYGLYCNDMNHREVEHEISSAIDKFAEQNDLPVHDWKTPYEEQYGTREETMIELYGWNDVSTTKIPLDKEIFALVESRNDPEKLRPEVIIARMRPAKHITWAKSKEGDVLCYDCPSGNFHSCNGNQIKYWKPVEIPKKFDSAVCDVVEAPKDCFDAELAIPPEPKPKRPSPEAYWRFVPHCFAPDEYYVQWKCECDTVNSFRKTVPELCNFPAFSVYCSHCNRKLDVTFDLSTMDH